MRARTVLAPLLAAVTLAPVALGQETRPGTIGGNTLLLDDQKARQRINPNPPLGLLPAPEDALMDPRMARSWATLPPRWFISSTVDVGFVYLRPRVSVGYGRPFTEWVGIDANPLATGDGIGVYGGLRFALPFADLRVGPRYFSSFRHTVLDVKDSYYRLDLETASGKKAQTLTYEAELDMSVPIGVSSLLARGSVSYVTGVDENHEVFEETLHVIVRPPLVWRARGGYAFRFGAYKQHSIGIVTDVLDIPKREDSVTVRVGPVMRLVLSRRVELRGSFVFTVVSPDHIGLVGGDFTELGVRYRWASE
jgi:hypothetical protein